MRANGLAPVEGVALGDGLRGRVAPSVDQLVREGLTPLAGEAAWTSPEWWRFVEADPTHESLYLVVDDADGRPLAVAPALLIRDASSLLFYNGPRILGDFSAIGSLPDSTPAEQTELSGLEAAADALRPTLYPSLTVGSFGSNFGLRCFAADVSPPPAEILVPAIARLAAVTAERIGCPSHALLYLDPAQDAALGAHDAGAGLNRSVFGGEGILNVPGGGFDEYLANLSSSRRVAIRREIRAYAEFGARTTVEYGPAALTDDHVELRSALRAKYGHSAGEAWVRQEFDALRATMGERIVVFSTRHADRIPGYLMAFRFDDVLYTRAAGFDYEALAGTYCYFNLVYYDVIKWAHENGVRRIHYGLGSSEAKVRRGCELLPRWAYFRLPPGAPAEATDLLAIQHATACRLLAGLGVDVDSGISTSAGVRLA